jgi:hypothetical protein
MGGIAELVYQGCTNLFRQIVYRIPDMMIWNIRYQVDNLLEIMDYVSNSLWELLVLLGSSVVQIPYYWNPSGDFFCCLYSEDIK